MSWKQAMEFGMPFYFNGKPCLQGNVAMRETKTRNCLCENCHEQRLAATRKWRADQKKKI